MSARSLQSGSSRCADAMTHPGPKLSPQQAPRTVAAALAPEMLLAVAAQAGGAMAAAVMEIGTAVDERVSCKPPLRLELSFQKARRLHRRTRTRQVVGAVENGDGQTSRTRARTKMRLPR